jgi:hypothetical protein
MELEPSYPNKREDKGNLSLFRNKLKWYLDGGKKYAILIEIKG